MYDHSTYSRRKEFVLYSDRKLVRISNHCARLYVWNDMLEKNPKWKGLPIESIDFEDLEDTFNQTEYLRPYFFTYYRKLSLSCLMQSPYFVVLLLTQK